MEEICNRKTSAEKDSEGPGSSVSSLFGRTDKQWTAVLSEIRTVRLSESRQWTDLWGKSGQTADSKIRAESGQQTDTGQDFPENPDKNETMMGHGQLCPQTSAHKLTHKTEFRNFRPCYFRIFNFSDSLDFYFFRNFAWAKIFKFRFMGLLLTQKNTASKFFNMSDFSDFLVWDQPILVYTDLSINKEFIWRLQHYEMFRIFVLSVC